MLVADWGINAPICVDNLKSIGSLFLISSVYFNSSTSCKTLIDPVQNCPFQDVAGSSVAAIARDLTVDP